MMSPLVEMAFVLLPSSAEHPPYNASRFVHVAERQV